MVMLEKIAGLALVSRLRAILIFEADFNMTNNTFSGKRILDITRAAGIIPDGYYNNKGKTAEDGKFADVLMCDLSRQKRKKLAVVSADAGGQLLRQNPPLYHGVSLPGPRHTQERNTCHARQHPDDVLLPANRMGSVGQLHRGDPRRILHGMCQGNGAAPAAWLVL